MMMIVIIRERTILARTDTSIRVYTTADNDTSTPCVGVPATCNIRPGRSNAAYTQWVAHADH